MELSRPTWHLCVTSDVSTCLATPGVLDGTVSSYLAPLCNELCIYLAVATPGVLDGTVSFYLAPLCNKLRIYLPYLGYFAQETCEVVISSSRGRYHGGRRPLSDDSFHSPTVIPPSALDKPSIMKRYHRRPATR